MIALEPIYLSLVLATITTIILILIGIPIAFWLSFTKNPIKPILEPLVSMPLVLPPTVLGFYLLLIFKPIAFTFGALIIGSVFFSLPFMINPVKSAFDNFPQSLLDASYTLGKNRRETLLHVILPNIKPALLTGIVMSFAHTIGEFGVVLMLGGNIPNQTRVASIAVFTEVEALNFTNAHIYSIILFILAFSILFLLNFINQQHARTFK